MSNQPLTSAAYYQKLRWTDSEESNSDDEDRGRMATSTREIPVQNGSAEGADFSEPTDGSGSDNDEVETPPQRRGRGRPRKYGVKIQDGSDLSALYHSRLGEENSSDNDEAVEQKRRPGRPRKDEVKSRTQLLARSKGVQFTKKPKAKPTAGCFDFPPTGEGSDSGEEEEDESSQPQIRSKKGRFAKKPKAKAFSPDASLQEGEDISEDNGSDVEEEEHRSHLQTRYKGRFLKKFSSRARGSDDSDDEEVRQPPKKKKVEVLTDEQIKSRKRQNELKKKKKAQWDAAEALQATRDLEHNAKRERPLNRYVLERPPPPSASESDEEPKAPPPPPTEAELAARQAAKQERHRLYEEGKAKRQQKLAKKRETERIRRLFPSTPRTGPPPNNGMFAVESRRLLEKEEKSGFKHVAHRIQKKEETDSEEDDLSENDEPKSRYHSAKILVILEDEFKNAQYLDVKTTRRLARITKLKSRQISDWFANTRRKVQRKFKNGKIAELPKQMKALEELNKERKERGEHLKMRDPEESDEEEDEEDYEDDDESSGDDMEEEPEVDERFEAVESERAARIRQIDHLSTVGYPVFPAPKASQTNQNGGP
ncbi:hypothetical protein CAEBREN_08209 [Caenorhabditis brenneri]|uniref:Homeobox domain-containing protein n=1 Tax=Caenorhabditis brenneri TaxID=135651 RepID=G0MCW5_CAEBE|nr:hypothetical protein CAEBREN_08209 [Caenorhabditis brenneri]